jgi:hypothetical protein
VATAVALTAARLVAGDVDPLAELPPAPSFRAPLGLVWLTPAVVAALALAAGLLGTRSAARADVTEVLRLGE